MVQTLVMLVQQGIWCFGLINAPMLPHLTILEKNAPSFMTVHSLVHSKYLKQGKWLTRGAHAWYLGVLVLLDHLLLPRATPTHP